MTSNSMYTNIEFAFKLAALRIAKSRRLASRDSDGRARRRQRHERGAMRIASVFREPQSCRVRFPSCFALRSCLARRELPLPPLSPVDARAAEKPPRDKSAFLHSPRTEICPRMADDNHENGTSNGDVPEIELIIKVSAPRAIVNRQARQTDR